MKKIFALLLSLTLCGSAFAQGFGSMSSDMDLFVQLGDSPFTFQPISYVHWGMSGILNSTDEIYAKNTSFVRNQQFGFNMVELSFHPYRTGALTLGADVEWNWFNLSKDYMWVPNESNGTKVVIKSKAEADMKEIKKTVLSVCTFGFPLSYTQRFGKFAITAGATAELNLNACVQFKGIMTDGTLVSEMKGGKRYSKYVTTNVFTYNIHAAISYGGLGIYAKYRPMHVLKEDYGPQFQTWTLGLVIGMGM